MFPGFRLRNVLWPGSGLTMPVLGPLYRQFVSQNTLACASVRERRLSSRRAALVRPWTIFPTPMEVVIVGAGTVGGSLAWWFARSGDDVTLVDQFEPGDPRASSGGETRLYRCAHGADLEYTAMARRARSLWRELEDESGEDVLIECGMAWLAHREDGWEAASARTLAAQEIPVERLDIAAAAGLYPSFRGDDLAFVLFEPEGGVLRAERSMKTLAAQAVAHGARIVRGRATPEGATVVLEDATGLEADGVIWAWGPGCPKTSPPL